MDEPTVGIDPQSRNHILESVRALRDAGTTILYTSHYMEEVQAIASRVAIMDQGHVIASGTIDELVERIQYEEHVTVEVGAPSAALVEELKGITGVKEVSREGERIIIVSEAGAGNLDRVIACAQKAGGVRCHCRGEAHAGGRVSHADGQEPERRRGVMSRFIVAFRCSFLQLVRNVQGMVFLLGMPLFIIPILGSVFAWIPADASYLKGVDTSTFFAVGMMIFFQLFGGSYSMTSVKAMFLSPRRWRIRALPCRPTPILLGILGASTLISLAQGFLLVAFSRVFLGARFGNAGIVLVVLLGIALLSQLIWVTLLLLVRNDTAASVLAWIVSYGSGVLGGIIFPLPEGNPFFRFTATYGTPFSLAQTALLDASRGGPAGEIALCIGILFLAAAVCACLTALLGRRKLA